MAFGAKRSKKELQYLEHLDHRSGWAFVAPTPERSFENLEEYHRKVDIAFAFWRKFGFRRVGLTDWFCYAVDSNHPSRLLPPGQDIDLSRAGDDPEPEEEYPDRGLIFISPYTRFRARLPLHFAVTSMPNEELYPYLDKLLEKYPNSDSLWATLDNKGNTFLHVAAIEGRYLCLEWHRSKLGNVLKDTRNNRYPLYSNCIRNNSCVSHTNPKSNFPDDHEECLAYINNREWHYDAEDLYKPSDNEPDETYETTSEVRIRKASHPLTSRLSVMVANITSTEYIAANGIARLCIEATEANVAARGSVIG